MSLSNVLAVIACLNLRTFQISELEGQFTDGDFLRNRMLTSGLAFILTICVVIYQGYGRYESLCICLFMVYKISESLADVLHGIDQKAWRLDIAGRSFILRGITSLLAMACGLLLGGNLIVTIILMADFAYLVIFFYDYKQCKKLCHPDFRSNKKNVLLLIKIGVPLALCSILLNLISTYPRFQIEGQYGKELLGVFASISTPTVLVTQLSSFIFSPLMGIFAERRKEHNKKDLYKLLAVSFGGIILIGVLSVTAGNVMGEWVLVLLFGESILEYAYLLVPIIYTAILTAIIWLLCGLLTVFRDYNVLAIITFISLAICLLLAPDLISGKQLMGAVLVLIMVLTVETVLLFIRFLYMLKKR